MQTEIPETQKDGITHRAVRAFVFFSTFDPMQGYAPVVTSPPGTTAAEGIFRQTFLVKGWITSKSMARRWASHRRLKTSLYSMRETLGPDGILPVTKDSFIPLKGHGETGSDAYQLWSTKDIKCRLLTRPSASAG